MIKKKIKSFILNLNKSIRLEGDSDINFNVINHGNSSEFKCKIINSKVSFTEINEGCVIVDSKTYGNVSLGRFVTITGPGTVLKSLNKRIQIGSFTSIGQNVCIVDFNHHIDKPSSSFLNHLVYTDSYFKDIVSDNIVIEEDVFIGSNSVILPGVTIGRGSIIGAGSIVNSDIPRYSIAVGNPVKVKKKRFSEASIRLLEDLKWWDWSIEKINKNKDFFNSHLDKLKNKDIKIL
tara:strand:- start:9481 stop:10182 length:702 start_codon:yes stop_codon:yes gene_type:complete